MRTLAITQNVTVDGAVEMLGDWFSAQSDSNVELQELTRRDQQEADAFLVGRRTFTDMRGYWPHLIDDTTGVTDYLNQVAKYVVSSTITDPGWAGTTVLSGDPVEQVRALKEQPGRDIVVTGSITLTHTLLAAGLVEQVRLIGYPVVQGRGRRLFPDGLEIPRLRLLEGHTLPTGLTYTRYALA